MNNHHHTLAICLNPLHFVFLPSFHSLFSSPPPTQPVYTRCRQLAPKNSCSHPDRIRRVIILSHPLFLEVISDLGFGRYVLHIIPEKVSGRKGASESRLLLKRCVGMLRLGRLDTCGLGSWNQTFKDRRKVFQLFNASLFAFLSERSSPQGLIRSFSAMEHLFSGLMIRESPAALRNPREPRDHLQRLEDWRCNP